jgi:hypothetical protein
MGISKQAAKINACVSEILYPFTPGRNIIIETLGEALLLVAQYSCIAQLEGPRLRHRSLWISKHKSFVRKPPNCLIAPRHLHAPPCFNIFCHIGCFRSRMRPPHNHNTLKGLQTLVATMPWLILQRHVGVGDVGVCIDAVLEEEGVAIVVIELPSCCPVRV